MLRRLSALEKKCEDQTKLINAMKSESEDLRREINRLNAEVTSLKEDTQSCLLIPSDPTPTNTALVQSTSSSIPPVTPHYQRRVDPNVLDEKKKNCVMKNVTELPDERESQIADENMIK